MRNQLTMIKTRDSVVLLGHMKGGLYNDFKKDINIDGGENKWRKHLALPLLLI